MKKFSLITSVLLSVMAVVGCDDVDVITDEEVDVVVNEEDVRIGISESSVTLTVGQEYDLTLSASSSIDVKGIAWSQKDPDVLEVSFSGESCHVKALKAGTDEITATYKGASASCTVTVTESEEPGPDDPDGPDGPDDPDDPDGPEGTDSDISLSLDAEYVSLTEGEGYLITATLTSSDSSVSVEALTWSNSNPEVVEMAAKAESCEIYAIQSGVAVITVMYGDASASCTVEVTGADTPATTSAWYVVGEFNGWDADTGIEMAYIGDGCYTADITLTADADEFKFLYDKSWEVNYGSPDPAVFMQQDTAYWLLADGYNLMTAILGTFTVYFYPESAEVYYIAVDITGDNPNAGVEGYEWYVVGQMTGNWDLEQGIHMDGPDADGFYKATVIVTDDANLFKVVANRSWAVNYGIGPDGSISTVEAGVLYDATPYGGNIQLTTPGAYTVMFNYSQMTFQFVFLGGSSSDGGGTEGYDRGDEYIMD